jgi:hypothetical protein
MQERRFAEAMALGCLGEEEFTAVGLVLAPSESSFVIGLNLVADGLTVTR